MVGVEAFDSLMAHQLFIQEDRPGASDALFDIRLRGGLLLTRPDELTVCSGPFFLDTKTALS